jgi:hypothetical protein
MAKCCSIAAVPSCTTLGGTFLGVMNNVKNDEKSEQDGWFKKFTRPRLMFASFLSLLKHIRYISMDLDWVDGPELPKVFNVTEFWEQR